MRVGDPPPTLVGRCRELKRLDQLLEAARRGNGGVLVLRGEAGVGKTALLQRAIAHASGFRVAHAAGADSETDLSYAGIHQLCRPLLNRLERLPEHQREVLEVACGWRNAEMPDRMLVGLALSSLLAVAASKQPLLCVADDLQWLDRASVEALSFVARRVHAEPIAMIFAVGASRGDHELAGLPDLMIDRLDDWDARTLLTTVMPGPMHELVRERILGEARGNPLALIELRSEWTPAVLAGGYGFADCSPLAAPIDGSLMAQLAVLPDETQQLLLIAAADPGGCAPLLWGAAAQLGLGIEAAVPAEAAGLITIGASVRFRHPRVRSAIYRAATQVNRRKAHRALADACGAHDGELRAWHLAHATHDPDHTIAAALESSATRVRARGGVAAAAAFMARATHLTPDSADRGRRALAAAHGKLDVGAPDVALELIAVAQTELLDDRQRAECELLRARAVLTLRRRGDASSMLLAAAERLTQFDVRLARETYLEALLAAVLASGQLTSGEEHCEYTVACAGRAAPVARQPIRGLDLLLDGLVVRFTDGHRAAVPLLQRALGQFRSEDARGEGDPRWYGLAAQVANDVWDDEAWDQLTARQVELLRHAGALGLLPIALAYRTGACVHTGRLSEAEALLHEAAAISAATGSPVPGYIEPILTAFRGQRDRALKLIRTNTFHTDEPTEGRVIPILEYAAAVLHNSFGEYRDALAATEWAVGNDDFSTCGYALMERVEAAARTHEFDIATDALSRLTERTEAVRTELALGVVARSRALLAEGPAAERLYRDAITHLQCSRSVMALARSRLIYGEWLRRMKRRGDAIDQLQQAHEIFDRVGALGFVDRTRRELNSTGGPVTPVASSASAPLTAQESCIARLARDGHTNQEIATELFLSPRTVEWHLSKVFSKLSIRSRRGLRSALDDTSD